ncbi:MAG TPA: hypothetical protein VHO50_11975 [Bacteroidales bacterium]|nr:hypothetical protein [Bacteroidales bacterium]
MNGSNDEVVSAQLTDKELLLQFREVEKLDKDDKHLIKTFIDAFLTKRFRSWQYSFKMSDDNYIREQYQALKYSNEQFDKNVLFIASGALGISFAFIEKVIPVIP